MKWATRFAALDLGHERRNGFRFLESYVQRGETAQAKIFSPDNRLRGVESQVRRAARESFESQLAFDSRERGPETEVTGPAKSQVTIICARQVQGVRIGKSFGVTIAGRHHRNYRLSFAN